MSKQRSTEWLGGGHEILKVPEQHAISLTEVMEDILCNTPLM